MSILFKDVNKRNSDLITKDFAADENKFKVVSKTSRDVSFETTLSSKADTVGTFAPKFEYKPWNATFSGEFTTKRDGKAEVSVKDPFPGSKLTLTGQTKSGEAFATLAVEYKQDVAAATASVDYGKKDGQTVIATANLGLFNNFSLGGSLTSLFKTGKVDLKELKGVVAYATPEFDVGVYGTLKSEKDGDKLTVGANYFHKLNGDLSAGADVAFDPRSNDKPSLSLAAQYKLDDASNVKGKVDTTGKIGLFYKSKVSPSTNVTFSAAFDSANFSNKASTQYGFSLTLGE